MMTSPFILLIISFLPGSYLSTDVPQHSRAPSDHVYQASDWALDSLIPTLGNESIIWEEVKSIHATIVNPDVGPMDKVMGVCLVLFTIADHHPGFSAVFILNIVMAFFLPVIGLIFCCCRLCGKSESSFEANKCDDCKKMLWGSLLTICLTAIFITSVAALIATFEANTGARNLPNTVEDVSKDIQTYFNRTQDSIEEVLVDDALTIQSELIDTLFDDPENDLTARFDNLEDLYNASRDHIKLLLTLCNEKEDCKKMLGSTKDIDNYLATDFTKIRLFLGDLENHMEDSSSPFLDKLSMVNKEISEKISNIQSVLENLTNIVLSKSSAYQNYVHYVFIGGVVLVSFIFSLLLNYVLGLFLIMFGSSPTETDPCGANKTTGGRFLISGVYLALFISTLLLLLAGPSLVLSYWGRLGLCKPNSLEMAITNTDTIHIMDILQSCHHNQTLTAAFLTATGGNLVNPDELDFQIGKSNQLHEFDIAKDTLNKVLKRLKNIKEEVPSIDIDDEISEVKSLQRALEETELLVKKLLEGNKIREQIIEIAPALIMDHIDSKVGSCAPLSANYNLTIASICSSIINPVTSFWFSVQGSIILCLVSIPLAVLLSSLAMYKEEYGGVFMNDVIEMEQRVVSNLEYRASRLYT